MQRRRCFEVISVLSRLRNRHFITILFLISRSGDAAKAVPLVAFVTGVVLIVTVMMVLGRDEILVEVTQ